MAKCSECGFLTLRNRATGELVESDKDYRAVGIISDWLGESHLHNWPLCFVQAWDLSEENEAQAQKQFVDHGADWEPYVVEILNRERECPKNSSAIGYTRWQQGFTPKEHREMLDRHWMREREERRDKEQREWLERQKSNQELSSGVLPCERQ